ncbi:ArnT family glycosyltransferase [Nocardia blacklockiae]|uniref:ArnT family glycosyltransferase n=1 Tax=Nocardia blacklockiae TaxID=480036 RepID=UPI0018931430|nr:glycosyltransferase family 39 protein [Nocardia blacklockiae]MBF6175924.1 glycosyltransferase family 39 protein [Nocardia blacklockiae]
MKGAFGAAAPDRVDTVAEVGEQRDGSRETVPPFAFRPVAAVAGLAALILVVRADRYDWFGDELYFLAAGRRPAFGYVDQGPLVPLLARCADLIAPGSLVVLRLPSILATVGAIVLSAALAREFGGLRAAQVLAALAYATCPFLVTQAATLSTFALDTTLTAAVIWLLVCWNRIRDDRLLLAAAAVAALDVQVKLLVAVPLLGLALGVAACGPRELLRRRALWFGTLLVGASALPGLLWQARHGWPQLAMGGVIRAEQQAATGGTAGLPLQTVLLMGLLGGLLTLAAVWAWAAAILRRSGSVSATGAFGAALVRHRFVAVAVGCQIVFVAVTGTRPYYLAGLFPVVFAVGAVWVLEREVSRRLRGAVTVVTGISAAIVVTVLVVLPLPQTELRQPSDTQSRISARLRMFGTSGWDHLGAAVTAAYRGLAPEERARAVIVTQTYWQASALDHFGGELPAVYSPNRGFAYFGTPPESATTVLYLAPPKAAPRLRETFAGVRPVAVLDDRLGFPGIDRELIVWRCDRPQRSWAATWPSLTTTVLDPGI